MVRQFDTWVDRTIDVATVRDDQVPVVLELLWQPLIVPSAAQWHNPIMDRALMKDPDLSRQCQDNLSLLAVPDAATPIDAFHYYGIRARQIQGSLCFLVLIWPPGGNGYLENLCK